MNTKNKNMPDFWRLARNFLHEYMSKARRLSPTTVASYKDSLNSFITYLSSECLIPRQKISFDEFGRDRLKAYIAWMTDSKGNAPKTVNLRMTAIKSFLKFCADEDISLVSVYNGAKALKGMKMPKRPIQYLAREATVALLDAFSTETRKERRNRMMLILLYDSAARVQELVDLTTENLHIDAPHPFVTLVGKGSKTRNVPLMSKTIAHLKVYLNEFHRDSDCFPLFFGNRDGKPHALSTDSVSLILKKAANRARQICTTVPDDVHCHLMRKTRAMDLYREGVSLPIVMQILGHESMSTTSGFYAFATMEMMFDAMETINASPSDPPPKWKEKEIEDILYSLD
jgi:site-specific recombinase XerD